MDWQKEYKLISRMRRYWLLQTVPQISKLGPMCPSFHVVSWCCWYQAHSRAKPDIKDKLDELTRSTRVYYIKISHCSQSNSWQIKRVGDKVHHVPHVADVLLETDVPQLLDLGPDEASHPGQDARLHQGGFGSSLGGVGVVTIVPAYHVLYPLWGQYQQN